MGRGGAQPATEVMRCAGSGGISGPFGRDCSSPGSGTQIGGCEEVVWLEHHEGWSGVGEGETVVTIEEVGVLDETRGGGGAEAGSRLDLKS